MSTQADLLSLVTEYHRAFPERIRRYLNGRGITDPVIDLHFLGWNGERITIPVFDRDGKLAFFKLAKDPEDSSPSPKMLTPAGVRIELYGWERVRVKPCRIVICEGEFDRLVLEAQGIAAVTSTGGAGVFRKEWAEEFQAIPEVLICFDRDEAGRKGAERVGRMIPHARIVALPEQVGEGGDVTDFFVRLRWTREDFEKLLDAAKATPAEKREVQTRLERRVPRGRSNDELVRLKSSVRIDSIVGRYVLLRPSGANLVGLCPFHEDHRPSLVVYRERQGFHCFGCQAHGDVVDFLMRIEKLGFREAVEVLKRLAA
jgi:DNA primase